MAGPARVVGPDGKVWTVRRRWFPWRRALSLRALWHSTPDEPAEEPSESTGPENPVLAVIGVLLWLVITAGAGRTGTSVRQNRIRRRIRRRRGTARRVVHTDSARRTRRRTPQALAQALSATHGDAAAAIVHANSAGTSITR